LGSAPASGAVGRALAAHCVHPIRSLFGALLHAGVRREGAPNSSRGGCARAPERVLGRSGESPLSCGEESWGIEA